ncbi:hypothetical protein CNR22_00170 [Sphingobacteriaceae bacterium]|nr:hypothetical protein CNR22_00170 [Sphingobacteriaceae bacterium]
MSLKFFHFLVFILINFQSGLFFSQRAIEPQKMKQFNITINFDDYTVKTQMLSQNKNLSVSNDKIYMWYASQKIIETKGGYDGRLIHGIYRSFYLNNQLKEQGQIHYGLRNKQWKYWYPDGMLKEVIHWKNGVKSGTYLLYNDYGQLMARGKFKRDKLHGNFYTYNVNGKVTEKKKYRHGDEKQPKIKNKHSKKEQVKTDTKERGKKSPSKDKTKKSEQKKPFLKNLFKRHTVATDSSQTKEPSRETNRKEKKTEKKKSSKSEGKKSERKSVTT